MYRRRSPCALALVAALWAGGCRLDHGDPLVPADVDPSAALATTPPPAATEAAEEPEAGRRLGEFRMTYYWMARERDLDGGPPRVIYGAKDCRAIATVSTDFARRLITEGTGQLRDGRVVNTAGPCACPGAQCFFVVAKHKRWGVGVGKKALSPFRTVAVDPRQVPIGTMLYIPELDGKTMPGREPWGGFVHDGCVLAADRGGGIDGNQLDFFVAQRLNYSLLSQRYHLKTVTVFDGSARCHQSGNTVAAVRGAI